MSLNMNVHKFENLEELTIYCIKFYDKNKEKFKCESISERRANLSILIEKFHKEAGTLNSEVKEKIVALRTGQPVILMTAHQPNLLPYSGVLRKATLNHTLGIELEKQLGVQVINFFGIADQDFSDERWVQSTLFPSIYRKDGILNLNIKIPSNIIFYNVKKPSKDVVKKWKDEISVWLYNATYSIENFCKNNGIKNWNTQKKLLYNNFELFWEIIEKAHEKASTFSDFNAFVMSNIINEVWKYDTLFSRFSECQSIFTDEFNYLMENFNTYSASLNETVKKINKRTQKGGVRKVESKFLPFWYHCDCGSKARLHLICEKKSLISVGNCIECNKELKLNIGTEDKPDVTAISKKISARAIPMILIFSKGLGLTNYVGGAGSVEYLKESRHIANKIDVTLPPFVFWRPRDKYVGIGQLEAKIAYKRITGNYEVDKCKEEMERMKHEISKIHKEVNILEDEKRELFLDMKKGQFDITTFKKELKKIIEKINYVKKSSDLFTLNRDLKILENLPNTMNLIPSILDYAINIGLKETSKQWITFLINNGSLFSEVTLTSIINEFSEITDKHF